MPGCATIDETPLDVNIVTVIEVCLR